MGRAGWNSVNLIPEFDAGGLRLDLQVASALDACVQAYLAGSRSAELQKLIDGSEPEDEVHEGYRAVILAKADEDTLVSFILLCHCKASPR